MAHVVVWSCGHCLRRRCEVPGGFHRFVHVLPAGNSQHAARKRLSATRRTQARVVGPRPQAHQHGCSLRSQRGACRGGSPCAARAGSARGTDCSPLPWARTRPCFNVEVTRGHHPTPRTSRLLLGMLDQRASRHARHNIRMPVWARGQITFADRCTVFSTCAHSSSRCPAACSCLPCLPLPSRGFVAPSTRTSDREFFCGALDHPWKGKGQNSMVASDELFFVREF